MSTPWLRLVGVQPDGRVHVRRSAPATASASSDVARSQPTVTIVVDAGGHGLGDELGGARRPGRWQCESSQPASGLGLSVVT